MTDFNVKDYGAMGDGSTDDTAYINLTVAAANANQGGTVFFPAGVYLACGIDVYNGLTYAGDGSHRTYNPDSGNASTKIVYNCPSPDTAHDSLFRVPRDTFFDTHTKPGTLGYLTGVQFRNMEISGGLNTEIQSIPSSQSGNEVVGIDLRTNQKRLVTLSSSTFTLPNHGFSNNDIVQFHFIGGTAPTISGDIFYHNQDYYIVNSATNTFQISLISGGTAITFSGSGTQTSMWVGQVVEAATYSLISDMFIHNFDWGIIGSEFFDYGLQIINNVIASNYVGYEGQEDPQITHNHIQLNYCGVTGRFVDFEIFNNMFEHNNFGIAPKGTINGNPFQTDLTEAYDTSIGTGNICNNVFYNHSDTAIRATSSTNITGNYFAGGGTSSISSVTIQGINVNISANYFGEGGAAASAGKAEILLDGEASNNAGVNISGNYFNTAVHCIIGANTRLTSPVYGTSPVDLGAKTFINIVSNYAYLQGGRFLYYPSIDGLFVESTISNNYLAGISGLSVGDGLIEGSLQFNMISSNYFLRNGTSATKAIKYSNLATESDDDSTIVFNRAYNFTAPAYSFNVLGNVPGNLKMFGNEAQAPALIADSNNFSGVGTTRLLGQIKAADFNTTSDQALWISSTRYIIDSVVVDNASGDFSDTTGGKHVPLGGIYTQLSKGGTAIVPAAQSYVSLTSSAIFVTCSLDASTANTVRTENYLVLSLSTARGVAGTADVRVFGRDLNG